MGWRMDQYEMSWKLYLHTQDSLFVQYARVRRAAGWSPPMNFWEMKDVQGKPSNEKLMWAVYSCDGQVDKTTKHTPECKVDNTTPGPSPDETVGVCIGDGRMVQADIPGCGGWINMKCPGSCIFIHKILFSCNNKTLTTTKQIEKVR